MPIIYKRGVPEDIDILTEMRNRVLIAANKLPSDTDMSEISRKTHEYYKSALAQGSHIAYLAYDKDRIAGTGGVSFYRVMPTYRCICRRIFFKVRTRSKNFPENKIKKDLTNRFFVV